MDDTANFTGGINKRQEYIKHRFHTAIMMRWNESWSRKYVCWKFKSNVIYGNKKSGMNFFYFDCQIIIYSSNITQ